MRPIETLALLVAGLATIKFLVIFVKPSAWSGVVHKTYGRPAVTVSLALILAAVFLNILLKEISIVQIFGAMAFLMALMLAGAASFGDEITALAEKMLKDRDIIKRAWLIIAVWIALIVWVLCEIFS